MEGSRNSNQSACLSLSIRTGTVAFHWAMQCCSDVPLPLWRVILAHGSLRVISVFFYNTFDFECEKSDCICFKKCAADVNSRNVSRYKDKMLSNSMWDACFSFAFPWLFPGRAMYRFS